MKNLLSEIIDWVKDKPLFWQEAIGRILQKNILTEDDISDLTNICKSENGLLKYDKNLIDLEQLKESLEESASAKNVSIIGISDIENINAIKNNSKIDIEEAGLTVIYGDNGSGKSSYVSVLKQVCNTRGGKPKIHRNLFLNQAERQNQKAKIQYKAGEETDFVIWENGQSSSNILKAVHIFDTKSAGSYIEDEDEIAFMPSGLLVIERLASACKKVEEKLNIEKSQLELKIFDYSFLVNEEDNEIQNFLKNIGVKSNLEELEKIAIFTTDDKKLLESIEGEIAKLKALDPTKKIAENDKIIERFETLKSRYKQIKNELSTEKISGIKKDILERAELQNAIKILTEKTFSNLPIAEIGTRPWKELWDSAKKFYEQSTQKKFPDLNDDSVCPLCLQNLGDEAKNRFTNFEEFVQSDIQDKLDVIEQRLNTSIQEIKSINLDFSEIKPTIDELNGFEETFEEYHKKVIEEIEEYVSSIDKIFTNPQKINDFSIYKIDISLNVDTKNAEPKNINLINTIEEIITSIKAENKKLQENSLDKDIEEKVKKLSLLKSKKELFENKEKIKNEIKRHKIVRLLNLCLNSCNTQKISLFSNKLSKEYVTDTLKNNFTSELKKLGFKNIKITPSTRGVSGKQFHSLTLDSSYGDNIALKDILSEGEHRCISLATFLSELSVSEHKSAIIFDDPVSSLDHRWRRKIAKRIIEEINKRQIIVFTHDITFLMNLQEFSEECKEKINIQSLTRNRKETGITATNPPWDALRTNARIGILKNYLQQLEKNKNEETEEIYKEKVSIFYGKLRETWERCIEEVVLNGVVQRFGRSVQTQRLKVVADLSSDDYKIIENNMRKCSAYIDGHDSAVELIEEMPDTDEIKIDIDTLENFVKDIRKRRK